MQWISRKDFLQQAGMGAALLLFPTSFGSCHKVPLSSAPAKLTVDFTLDISAGTLAKNGGYLVQNGVIIARTNTGAFIAVASTCTHQGSTIQFYGATNTFICPNHGAQFNTNGAVTKGPASTDLQKMNTTLTGTNLRVYS